MANNLQSTTHVKGATAIQQWYTNVCVRNSWSTELHLRMMVSLGDLPNVILKASFIYLMGRSSQEDALKVPSVECSADLHKPFLSPSLRLAI